MPDVKTLTERLRNANFVHLIEKTDLVDSLANKEVEAIGVVTAVDFALSDYDQNLQQTAIAVIAKQRKPQLLKVLLQDSLDAIKELEELHLL
jgi:hypothetical protein